MLSSKEEVVVREYMLGARAEVRGGIQFLSEETIIYVSGKVAVVHFLDTKKQEFLPATKSAGYITDLALSPKKNHIAVADAGNVAIVNIYDAKTLRRKNRLDCGTLATRTISHVSLSPDSRLCLVLGDSPDYNLTLWNIEKAGRIVSTVKLATQTGKQIYRADFCPTDQSTVCVMGNGVLRFFRLVDNVFRPVTASIKGAPQNYLCHCWIHGGFIAIGVDNGDVLILNEFEEKLVLCTDANEAICCIASFSRGLFVGSEDGTLRRYDQSNVHDNTFKLTKQFRMQNDLSSIRSMAVSPSEDKVVCLTKNNQMQSFFLKSSETSTEDGVDFKAAIPSFHRPGRGDSSCITGIDTCLWRPIIATCGRDKTVRIWNFEKKAIELEHSFKFEPMAISMHPCGLHLAIAFRETVQLQSILADRLRLVFKLNTSSSHICRFSHSGHYFAVASHSMLQVYNSFTCQRVSYFEGHVGNIESLNWKECDQSICTVGEDGAVFVWNALTGLVEKKIEDAKIKYKLGVTTMDFSRGCIVRNDNRVADLDLISMSLKSEIVPECSVSQIIISGSKNLLFLGASASPMQSTLRIHKVNSQMNAQYREFQCHAGPVSCMALSHDSNLLFTCGEDGSLCMFRISDRSVQLPVNSDTEQAYTNFFSEELMISKDKLDHSVYQIQVLQQEIRKVRQGHEKLIRRKETEHKEKANEVENTFQRDYAEGQKLFENLARTRQLSSEEFKEKMNACVDFNEKELIQMQENHKDNLDEKKLRFRELAEEYGRFIEQAVNENESIAKNFSKEVQTMINDHKSRIKAKQSHREHVAAEKDQLVCDFDRFNEMAEEDAGYEIQCEKIKYEALVKNEEEVNEQLKAKYGMMSKSYDDLLHSLEEQKEMTSTAELQEEAAREEVKNLRDRIQQLKEETQEREEYRKTLDRHIAEVEEKNLELERSNFVLDEKMRALKRQMESRQSEVSSIKVELSGKNTELESTLQKNKDLNVTASKLKMKLECIRREAVSQRAKISKQEKVVSSFQRGLEEAGKKMGNSKEFKASMKVLFDTHLNGSTTRKEHGYYSSSCKIRARRCEDLRKKISKMSSVTEKESALRTRRKDKLQMENKFLKRELNKLYREALKLAMEQESMITDKDV